jgi:hypothetical protein
MLQKCAQPDRRGEGTAATARPKGQAARLDLFLDRVAEGRDAVAACAEAGLSWRKVSGMIDANRAFAARWQQALRAAERLLDSAMLSRAVHGTPTLKVVGGKGAVETVVFDDALAIAVARRLDARAAAVLAAPAAPAEPPVSDAAAVLALQQLFRELDPDGGRADPAGRSDKETAPHDSLPAGPGP